MNEEIFKKVKDIEVSDNLIKINNELIISVRQTEIGYSISYYNNLGKEGDPVGDYITGSFIDYNEIR